MPAKPSKSSSEQVKPRRLLAVVGVYPPAGGAGAVRLCKLFKHLATLGWRIDVVAPHGGGGFFRDESLEQALANLEVYRVGKPAQGNALQSFRARLKDPNQPKRLAATLRPVLTVMKGARDGLLVPDEYVLWSLRAAWAALRLARQHSYDALFTSSFPYSVHLAGVLVQRLAGLPWWMELRDPWAGHVFRSGSLSRRYCDQRLQHLAVRHAARVSVIAPAVAELLRQQEGDAALQQKLMVLPNGFDPEDFPPRSVPTGPRRLRSEVLELVYTGSFDADLDPPGPMLRGLEIFAKRYPQLRHKVVLRVLGGADLKCSAALRQFMQAPATRGLVVMEGFKPHDQAIAAMQRADAVVLILTAAAKVYTTKVFEYLASGTPILALVGSADCRALLQECGGATVLHPDHSEALSEMLAQAVRCGAWVPALRRRPAALRAYGLDRLAQQLAAGLGEICEDMRRIPAC